MATIQEIADGEAFEIADAIREIARFLLAPAPVTAEEILAEEEVPEVVSKTPRKSKEVTNG